MRAADIGDLQLAELGHPQPCGIERGENGPVLQMGRGSQQGRDLGLAEDGGEGEGPPGMRDILQHGWTPQRHAIEEAQGTDGLHHRRPGELFVLNEKELIGADLLQTQVLGGGPKMPCEISDTVQIRANSMRRVVAELHVFQHALA